MSRFPLAQPDAAAVITGGASGIGAATALELARRGSHIALLDRDEQGLQRVAEQVRALGVTASTHVVDLSDPDSVTPVPNQVAAEHGGAHILVNCAGVSLLGTFAQLTLDEFDWLLRVNLWGTIVTTKLFLPHLSARRAAHISNLSSGYGLLAPPGRAPYATSKFGVRGFTESLRNEMAGGPVSVSVVHPGGIKTQIAMKARVAAAVDPAVAKKAAEAQTNAYRTTPEDAAIAIVAGIEKRRGRVLIGSDVRVLDAVARLTPAHYWRLIGSSLSAATRT
ncbi:hypothetical protein BMW26_14405 [Microbacterium sp. 1.5R]|uniref:SDR family NAD(P)-dependent oxidoreductase n=1 Tax=Microbacterium sp. 1.5R TaxID=1916917 RepID=UPI000909F5F2|nr:SDR family oxidoreductase [Microbacterium sp. 1.5R]APH46015.1 hypothetical protein BMW26_14405 [Microbacterium sp. 1.5R]